MVIRITVSLAASCVVPFYWSVEYIQSNHQQPVVNQSLTPKRLLLRSVLEERLLPAEAEQMWKASWDFTMMTRRKIKLG